MKPELPILPFASQTKWADWLAKQHDKSAGLWLKLAKKDFEIPSVTYEETLDIALCYGWIDGQKKGFDNAYWLQKFTPRGPKSIWSKINTEKAERLIASGQMKPAGLKAIEAAKADGRWAQAYSSQKNIPLPGDFQAALDKNKKAKVFFSTLNSANRYSFLFRIQTAKKAETRAKRIQQFVEMLKEKKYRGSLKTIKDRLIVYNFYNQIIKYRTKSIPITMGDKSMANVITLTCPSCGGKLQITNEIERFACLHCGNEHIVKRGEGIVSLAPVIEGIGKVQLGVDKTISELAIKRLREDIEDLNAKGRSISSKKRGLVADGLRIIMLGFSFLLLGVFFRMNGITLISLIAIFIGGSFIYSGIKKSDEEKRLPELIKEKKAKIRQHLNMLGE